MSRQSKLPESVIKQIAAYTSSSYRETVERGYTCFSVAVPREAIISTQRTLIDNAISMQELMSHVFRMISEKNPVFAPVLKYVAENPVRNGDDYVVMNENSLYALMEAARRQSENESTDDCRNDDTDPPASEDEYANCRVNGGNLNFKTFKQDKFLQRHVADAIIDLKMQASKNKMTKKKT